MKKIFFIALFFLATNSFAQLALSVYSDKAMSVAFPVNMQLFGEFRAYSNQYVKDMKMEPMLLLNINRKRTSNFYAGVGVVFAPNDMSYLRFSVPVGLQITPFKDFRNLAFMIEVAPEIYDEVYLRSMLGLRFIFMKQG